jgi:hypothetical protein
MVFYGSSTQEVAMGKDKKRKKSTTLVFSSIRNKPADLRDEQIRALFQAMHHPDAPTRKLVEVRRNHG